MKREISTDKHTKLEMRVAYFLVEYAKICKKYDMFISSKEDEPVLSFLRNNEALADHLIQLMCRAYGMDHEEEADYKTVEEVVLSLLRDFGVLEKDC